MVRNRTKSLLLTRNLLVIYGSILPRPSFFASSSKDGCIKIWDVNNSCQLVGVLGRNRTSVLSLDFHTNEDLLCSLDNRQTIRCWSIADGSCKNSFEGAIKTRFQPKDGRCIATIAKDKNALLIHDANTSDLKHTLRVLELWDIQKPTRLTTTVGKLTHDGKTVCAVEASGLSGLVASICYGDKTVVEASQLRWCGLCYLINSVS